VHFTFLPLPLPITTFIDHYLCFIFITVALPIRDVVVDEVRKKSKLQNILGTFGKKLGNKTKTLFQSIDFSQPQAVEAEQEFGQALHK